MAGGIISWAYMEPTSYRSLSLLFQFINVLNNTRDIKFKYYFK